MGIEPTSLAWEARVMPLYDARVACWFPGLATLRKAAAFYGPQR